MPVGVYDDTSEDGGMYVSKIVIQTRDDEDSQLYYKTDNPVTSSALTELVTIVGSGLWPMEGDPDIEDNDWDDDE